MIPHMGIVEHPELAAAEAVTTLGPEGQGEETVDPGKSRCVGERDHLFQEPCITIIKPVAWQDGELG